MDFSEDDPLVVKTMVRFFYKRRLVPVRADGQSANPGDGLLFCVKCYVLADKYDIPMMKKKNALLYVANVFIHAKEYPDDVARAIEFVYENTPESDRALRHSLLRFCGANLEALMQSRKFEQTMNGVDGIWKDLALVQSGIVVVSPHHDFNASCPSKQSSSEESGDEKVTEMLSCPSPTCGEMNDITLPRSHVLRLFKTRTCRQCGMEYPVSQWMLFNESDSPPVRPRRRRRLA